MYPREQHHHARSGASLVSPRVYPSIPQSARPHHLHISPLSEAGGRSVPNLTKLYQEHMQLPHSQSVYVANPAIHHNIPPVPRIPSQFAYPGTDRRLCQPYQPEAMPHSTTYQHHHPAGAAMTPSSSAITPALYSRIQPHGAATPGPLHVAVTPKADYMPGSFPTTTSFSPQTSHVATRGNNQKYLENGSRRIKKVALFQGNLVLDCPVPSRLIDANPRKDPEFCHMRYSAVTCDPDEFATCQYTLRPRLMNRDTELFIVMTMYNASNSSLYLSVRKQRYRYSNPIPFNRRIESYSVEQCTAS